MPFQLAYAVDEIPEPVVYTFQDSTGTAIDLTGYSATGVLTHEDGTETSSAGTIASPTSGQVSWSWSNGDLDAAGRYTLRIWVASGTSQRYCSDDIVVTVEDRGSYS